MKKTLIIAFVATLVLVGGWYAYSRYGAGNSSPSQNPSDNTIPPEVAEKNLNIFIRNFAFVPNMNAVVVGTKVTWTNEDNVVHTVTGDSWDSGQIAPGATFSRTFDIAGTFNYHCTIHPTMIGKVIVQ